MSFGPEDGRTRLAVDIGGTFTDIVLEGPGGQTTIKVPTTSDAPENGFMQGVERVCAMADVSPRDVDLIIHGTTLATNALIERRGAKTALLTTQGFRDTIEIAYEHRFDQSDVFMQRPAPLVPRNHRYGVPERMAADGSILIPLDEAAVSALLPTLEREEFEAVAIGFLHSHVNSRHEERVRDLMSAWLPELTISISSEVSPEIREYERISTTVANAYVQPAMSSYLTRLEARLSAAGFGCPLLLMMSSGGMTTLDTARRFPVRLVESGPAGGAILASEIASQCDLDKVVSFDMGGTTAKICLIDGSSPRLSRSFEVARHYRHLKGSGLPLRIPVIEMVEIGAGGGSIAGVDALGRVSVGPRSAGSQPGPASYGRGGTAATVTDADLVAGRILADRFSGGRLSLDEALAARALRDDIGETLGLGTSETAFAIAEIVDENMANAARVHCAESGQNFAGRALIAFGGAAPLHAARVAEKLGIDKVVVPVAAGVGSAIGFLRAPVGYEVIRSRHMEIAAFDPTEVNALFSRMRDEAETVIRMGTANHDLIETRTVYMRYRGQGHEIPVELPVREYTDADRAMILEAFDREYALLFGRTIPSLRPEAMTWGLVLATPRRLPKPTPRPDATRPPVPLEWREAIDDDANRPSRVAIFDRADLLIGDAIKGPAIVVEDGTSTYLSARFDARVDGAGHLILERNI